MLKIVIVDDDKTIRAGIHAILDGLDRGYEIDSRASDGKAALERVIEWKPDLLITDIKMPVMDGIKLVHTISEMKLPVKTIVISGYDELPYVKECLKAGVRDYLLKPLNKRDLVEQLDRMESAKHIESLRAQQLENLKRSAKESRFLRKERLLWDLVVNRFQDPHALVQRVSEFGLNEAASFIIAVIKLDKSDAKQSLSSLDWEQWIYTLSGEISWLESWHFSMQNEQMTILAPLDSARSDVDPTPFTWFSEQMKLYTASAFTTGISQTFQQLSYSPLAYQEAYSCLQRAFYEGTGKIYMYSKDEPSLYSQFQELDIIEYTQSLFQAIDAPNASKALAILNSMITRLADNRVEPSQFKGGLTNQVRKLYVLHPEVASAAVKEPRFDLLSIIEHAVTVQTLKEQLNEGLHGLILLMQEEQLKKDNRIIMKSKEIIQKNYQHNITLQTVAAQVNLNPNYFSNYFKQETGRNFLEYLLEVRIQAAKKLLAEPDVKVYEVGYLVGYENPSSFNRAFKNVTGTTPSEYRKTRNLIGPSELQIDC
ncbi:response regulator transcription factor [Paenibacillus hexagrammi]|uniref:Response regulator n=1 Tax=Paenibacillus hexagrammi TaxID=2908839 RepID=A0ABY3SCN2_9BACL|nr:response regulator [Paenibacillus sp. YPD9-1]UJF31758.1 response regulator [Paenibacillus sp. YPD9-1]